ncbi:hypothetical protein EXS65_04170 [Candidatus Peribacteria bacterium]|nr:hypothetical protein [Candidatus Peribacteria bacterium]
MLSLLTRLLTFASLLCIPLRVAAAGGADISVMFLNLVTSFTPLWVAAAILVVVTAGFTLVVSQEEGALDKARKAIMAVVAGGILVTIIVTIGPAQFVTNFFNGATGLGIPGTVLNNTPAGNLGIEAEGVAEWLTAMAAMIGLFIIIIAVVRAVTSFGGDDAAYTNVRNSLLQVIIGLIVIGAALLFKQVFFVDHEPSALIGLITEKIEIVLNFILLIAVGVLVYAGLRMVTSFGREEEYTAARSLMLRVCIGIAVIILAYSLVVIVARIF